MDLSQRTPVKNMSNNFSETCCDNLMVDMIGLLSCKKHISGQLGHIDNLHEQHKSCLVYKRDHYCSFDVEEAEREKVERENAERERVAKEKAEREEKELFDKMIADFTEVIRQNPNDWNCYRLRGDVYVKRNHWDQAIADFKETIRLNPLESDTYAALGAAYCQKGNYDQAMKDFNEALRIDPNCKNAYLFRGDMYYIKGEYDKSKSDYKKVLQFDPNDEKVTSLLGNIEKEEAKKAREKRKRIGRLSALVLQIIAIIMMIVGMSVFSSWGGGSALTIIFVVIITIIPFLGLFFSSSVGARIFSLALGMLLFLFLLGLFINYNDKNTLAEVIFELGYLLGVPASCIMAFIFPKEERETERERLGLLLHLCLCAAYFFILYGTDIIRAPWEADKFTFLRCLPLIIFSLSIGMVSLVFLKKLNYGSGVWILIGMILVQSITICVWRGDVGILLIYFIIRIVINTLCAIPGLIFASKEMP